MSRTGRPLTTLEGRWGNTKPHDPLAHKIPCGEGRPVNLKRVCRSASENSWVSESGAKLLLDVIQKQHFQPDGPWQINTENLLSSSLIAH
jgi:hypothetical protein